MPETAKASVQGKERRRFARVALDALVTVQVANSDRLFKSRIRDLSQNGVFIISESTRPIGTGVSLRVVVEKEGVEFRAEGIIVHEVTVDDGTGRPAGVGVMFTDVSGFEALLKLIAMGVLL